MTNKSQSKPSIGKAAKTSAGVARTKQQQSAAIERAIRLAEWVLGIIIALLPFIWSLVSAYALYGDNNDIKGLYIKFAIGFFVDGVLLWIAVTLLGTSLIDAALRSFRKKWKNITLARVVLFVAGSIIVVWGIIIYMGNIVNPITETRMLMCSVLAFIGFGFASGYLNSLFSRRT